MVDSLPSLAPAAKEDNSCGRTKLEVELERLTRYHIEILNERKWDEIRANRHQEYISPSMRIEIDSIVRPMSYMEAVTIIQRIVTTELPEYRSEIKSISVQVDEHAGLAEIFIEVEITGAPADLRRRAVILHTWKKQKGSGRWVWASHKDLRAGGPADGSITDH